MNSIYSPGCGSNLWNPHLCWEKKGLDCSGPLTVFPCTSAFSALWLCKRTAATPIHLNGVVLRFPYTVGAWVPLSRKGCEGAAAPNKCLFQRSEISGSRLPLIVKWWNILTIFHPFNKGPILISNDYYIILLLHIAFPPPKSMTIPPPWVADWLIWSFLRLILDQRVDINSSLFNLGVGVLRLWWLGFHVWTLAVIWSLSDFS